MPKEPELVQESADIMVLNKNESLQSADLLELG